MKFLFPNSRYFLGTRTTNPLSRKFGYDRGTPIDRYYIEQFLRENSKFVKGKCLEIVDNNYTVKFGRSKVTKSDILDNDPKNHLANIHADLRDLKSVQSNSYDCLIVTQTLGMVDDYEKAIKECYRILKPGGVMLVTVSSISPVLDLNYSMWRFTVTSCRYVFSKFFKGNRLEVKSYGNVLAGQCFWVGMAVEELDKEELDVNDPNYPCIIAVRATK